MSEPDEIARGVPGARLPRRRLTLRLRRVEGAPLVAVRVWMLGGSRLEALPGEALVTGRLLAEGSRRRSWERIHREAEDLGMMVETSAGSEALMLAIDALAEDGARALDWAAELALEPVWNAERCDWIRRQAAAELESLMDQPDLRTARAFLEQLYAPHPRGRPLQGSQESLARIDPSRCAEHHRLSLERGVLVVVTGEIDEDEVESRLRSLFADLHGEAAELSEPAAPDGSSAPRQRVRLPGSDQAHLFAGHLTLPRRHPDMAALEVLSVVLGAGAGLRGRLPERIRESEGLAYQAHAETAAGAGLDPGRLVAYVGTAPRNVERVEHLIREELERLLRDGLEAGELEDARAFLLGREPFRRETARQWASLLAETEFYGQPYDQPEWVAEQLRSLRQPDVEAAARRWLRPEELKVTVGLPDEKARGSSRD